jgi:hypothetical protein
MHLPMQQLQELAPSIAAAFAAIIKCSHMLWAQLKTTDYTAAAAAAGQVREAISILDLDVTVYPTPKGGKVWRPKAVELGGKAQ